MTTIKYVCSLGPRCHTAGFLKRNNIKKTSYPFDWIFSNPKMIIHCLEDNFKIFLDKEYFIIKDNLSNKQQHSFYSEREDEILFNHHNPLKQEDYNYFRRCIIRFKKLLLKPDLKLFIFTFLNYPKIDKRFKNNIIEFGKKIGSYTNNYGILCIIQHTSNELSHKFTVHNNIHFLEIFTKSSSNGIDFDDNEDNIYLDNIIKRTYLFDLLEIDPITKEELQTEVEEKEEIKVEEIKVEEKEEIKVEEIKVEEKVDEKVEEIKVEEKVDEKVEDEEDEDEEDAEDDDEEDEEDEEDEDEEDDDEEDEEDDDEEDEEDDDEEYEEDNEQTNKIIKGIVKELIEKIEKKEKKEIEIEIEKKEIEKKEIEIEKKEIEIEKKEIEKIEIEKKD